jgi:hypothetical protein
VRKLVQKERTMGGGNCLEVCLACIFDLKVKEVPDFNQYTTQEWIFKLSQWLQKEFKLSCLCISNVDEESKKLIRGYHIIICDSGYPDITHAIVSKDGIPYWDPMGKLLSNYNNIKHLVFISAKTSYYF